MLRPTGPSGNAKIDTVPLPERTARGKLTRAAGKYFLTVAGRKREIPMGYLIPEKKVRPLVGKDVAVVYSRTQPSAIVALGPWPGWPRRKPGFVCVLCYIPPPDIIRRIQDSVRRGVIGDLIKAGIISKQMGGILQGRAGR